MGVLIGKYVTRDEDSFNKLDSILGNRKEVDIVRIVKTDVNFPIISLYYFLDFPLRGFKEKYLTIDAAIKSAETVEGCGTVVNDGIIYGVNDAIISDKHVLQEQAMVAVMIEHLKNQGVEKVNLTNQYENGTNINIDTKKVLKDVFDMVGLEEKDLRKNVSLPAYLYLDTPLI